MKDDDNEEDVEDEEFETDIDSIIEEALVDSYGPEEQLSSMLAYMTDELQLPFKVSFIGSTYTVVGKEEQYNRLKLLLKINSKQYPVDLTDVKIINTSTRNYWLVEAYKSFISNF